MKNCWLGRGLVALCVLTAVNPLMAADTPAELLRDRQRAAEALKDKNPQRAAKLIEPWFKKRSDDIELANDYALALAQLGKLDEAREVLEEVLSKNPETSAAFQNLREILSQQAAISYAKAMGLKPPSNQVALRAGPSVKEPPMVVAQVQPRPGATTEPLPARVYPSASRSDARADGKSDQKSARGSDADKGAGASSGGAGSGGDPAIVAAMTAWADAWSDKDFKRYLAIYSEKFQPQQFPSRDAWAAHRKPRVTRPGPIVVKVSEIRQKPLSADQVEVKFRQRYEAGDTKLSSVKTLVWLKESDGWKILREEGR